MILNINLPEDGAAELAAKAEARGVSTEAYARQVLERDLEEGRFAEPFWKAFTQRVHALPSDAFDVLPTDGASEHDHYLYGAPKRNP